MTDFVKYALIAGGAGLAVFLVGKRLAAKSASPPKSTLGTVVDGFNNLLSAVRSNPKPSTGVVGVGTTSHSDINVPSGFGLDFMASDPATVRAAQMAIAPTPLSPSPFSAYAVWTADGDSAVSDALGVQKSYGTQGQPTQFTRFAQRATIGAIPNSTSPYAMYPARS